MFDKAVSVYLPLRASYAHGCEVDVRSADGLTRFAMGSVFNERERTLIGERTRAALALLKSRGVRLGRRPMRSSARRRVVALRDAGMTWRDVAHWLNAHGETRRPD